MAHTATYIHVDATDEITVERIEREHDGSTYYTVHFGRDDTVFLSPEQMTQLATAMRAANPSTQGSTLLMSQLRGH